MTNDALGNPYYLSNIGSITMACLNKTITGASNAVTANYIRTTGSRQVAITGHPNSGQTIVYDGLTGTWTTLNKAQFSINFNGAGTISSGFTGSYLNWTVADRSGIPTGKMGTVFAVNANHDITAAPCIYSVRCTGDGTLNLYGYVIVGDNPISPFYINVIGYG
jgi:hypothetical protein